MQGASMPTMGLVTQVVESLCVARTPLYELPLQTC